MLQNIVLVGLKGSGKSTVGQVLAKELDRDWIDTDVLIEKYYAEQTGNALGFAEIYQLIGEQRFRSLEKKVIVDMGLKDKPLVMATGGGAMLDAGNVACFKKHGLIVYLNASYATLLDRWHQVPPSFIGSENISQELRTYYDRRATLYQRLADMLVVVDDKSPSVISSEIIELIKEQ